MTDKTPLRLVCPECGSEDITRDASARWNPDQREWELSCVYDVMTCDDCGAEFYEARRVMVVAGDGKEARP